MRADGLGGKLLEYHPFQLLSDRLRRISSEHRSACRRAVDGTGRADAGDHADAAARLNFVQIDDLILVHYAQVRGLFHLGNETPHVGFSRLAQIVLLQDMRAVFQQSQPKPEPATACSLDHPVMFQNHQETMHRAFMKL